MHKQESTRKQEPIPTKHSISDILCSSDIHFMQIFELLIAEDYDVVFNAWQLLMAIPSNKSILSQLAMCGSELEEKFDIASPLELVYLVQACVNLTLQQIHDSVHPLWINKFITGGYFVKLCHKLALCGDLDEHISPLYFDAIATFVVLCFEMEHSLVLSSLSDCLHRLHSRAISFIEKILEKPKISLEDASIMSSAIKLCAMCAVKNPDSAVHLYSILSPSILGAVLICTADYATRVVADALIFFIINNPLAQTLAPLLKILQTLIPPHVDAVLYPCRHFFRVLCYAFSSIAGQQSQLEAAMTMCRNLRTRPILETVDTQEDEMLVGILNVLRALLSSGNNVANQITNSWKTEVNASIVHELFSTFLFATKADNTSQFPVCKSQRSRISAGLLLVELCRKVPLNFYELCTHLDTQLTGLKRYFYVFDIVSFLEHLLGTTFLKKRMNL